MTFPYIGNPPAPRIDYAALPGLLEKATPGPWTVFFRRDDSGIIEMGGVAKGPHKQFDIGLERGYRNDEDDAALIALAPMLAADNIRILAANADLMAEVGRLTALIGAVKALAHELSWAKSTRHISEKIAAATEAQP